MKKFMGVLITSTIFAASAFAFEIHNGTLSGYSDNLMSGQGSMFSMICVDDQIAVAFNPLNPYVSVSKGKKYMIDFWTDETRKQSQEYTGMTDNMIGIIDGSILHEQDFTGGELFANIPTVGTQRYDLGDNAQEIMDAFIEACIPEKTEKPIIPADDAENPSASSSSDSGCFIGGLF